jgi:hypothetical protein
MGVEYINNNNRGLGLTSQVRDGDCSHMSKSRTHSIYGTPSNIVPVVQQGTFVVIGDVPGIWYAPSSILGTANSIYPVQFRFSWTAV